MMRPILALVAAFAWGSAARAAPLIANDYLVVTRESAARHAFSDRCVIVALSRVAVTAAGARHELARGDFLVIPAGTAWSSGAGDYYLAEIRPHHPPGLAPAQPKPPQKNRLLADAPDFTIYEEALAPGDSRPAHTHNTRLTIVINATTLRGAGGQSFPQIPDAIKFIPGAANHSSLTNVGATPLRNLVIEFKAG